MSLSIGIVGLPNVGKSTLINALVKSTKAEASNYPFCTIDPNVGIVEVPDARLAKLSAISRSEKTIPTVIEFIDIAGLVRGAHKGEGLGNKFLSHIKETDAIAMVVRFFEDPKIVHTAGEIDPRRDIETINLELILADLQTADKALEREEKGQKPGDNDAKKRIAMLQEIKKGLEEELPIWAIFPGKDDLAALRQYQFLTTKPVLYLANVSETQISSPAQNYNLKLENGQPINFIPISAKIEAELADLDPEEQKEYLKSLNLMSSGLDRVIKAAYDTLGLITFFTSGEKETRAWTVERDATAPVAAGKIHTDFQRGFIAAEVVKYDDFIEYGWTGAKEKGLIKTEGKNYIVQDGDVIFFKFNV